MTKQHVPVIIGVGEAVEHLTSPPDGASSAPDLAALAAKRAMDLSLIHI